VGQNAKRKRILELLEVEEFQRPQAEPLRVDPSSAGLGAGTPARGLRLEDIRLENLTVRARRSIVDQVVGKVNTKASKRPALIDTLLLQFPAQIPASPHPTGLPAVLTRLLRKGNTAVK